MLSKVLSLLRSALVCTLSLLATAAVAQTTIPVGPGQTYTTIQSGIDAASNGDTVLVAPGTYNENINFKGKAITVTSSGGAATTTIQGDGTTSTVAFQSNESRKSVIDGFTIQGGISRGDPAGGGLFVQNASPQILNNIFSQNFCSDITSYDGAPLITGNILKYPNIQEIYSCPFEATWLALTSTKSSATKMYPEVIGNTISGDPRDSAGSGVVTGPGIELDAVNGAIIEGNVIAHITSQLSGAGIRSDGCTATVIAQNLIYQNGVFHLGGTLGGGGGGINVFVGGHIQQGPPTCLIVNNTIALNVDYTGVGGDSPPASQFYLKGNLSQLLVANNVMVGQDANPTFASGFDSDSYSPSPPVIENNDIFNSVGPACADCFTDPSGVNGNIFVDPLFVNDVQTNFRLQGCSPAIDAGDNSVLELLASFGVPLTSDLDGHPRVQNGSGKGAIVDMGAYEYSGPVSECIRSETLISSLNPALAGQSVAFTAQLNATSGVPTGAIQFLDGANLLSTQTVSATGSATVNTSSLAVGSHTITANYQPTGSFSATTASLTQVITGYPTTAALTCLPNAIDIGNTAQLTATVMSANGTPTGSISFTDNGAQLAAQTLLNGTASLTYTGTIAGTHSITATYKPAGAFAASSASCSEIVNALATTSTLTVAPATSTYGSAVTLTATVAPVALPAPSTPTGVVTFLNGSTALGTGTLAGGVASLPSVSLTGGSYNLTCVYSGSSIYSTSNCNPVSITVNAAPTALTLSSSQNPASALSPVTFSARLTVNGQSAGAGNSIHLSINSQTINLTTDATGSATYTIGTLQPNSYPVLASFAATNNLLASSSSLTEVITAIPTLTSLTGTPNPGDLNQPVTLTATVTSSTPSATVSAGKVTFYDGTTSLSSAPVTAGSTASVSASFSTVGVHDITAVYSGDTDFSTSTSPVFKETIVAGDFTIAVLPGAASFYTGQSTTMNVTVTSLQGFNQPLALTCIGLPADATCNFSPASLPQGQGAASLTIQTAAPHPAEASYVTSSAPLLGVLTLLLLPGRKRRRRFLSGLSLVLLAVGITTGLVGCGSPHPIQGGTPPGAYHVAVTAAAAGGGTALTHSAVVTLTVKSLF